MKESKTTKVKNYLLKNGSISNIEAAYKFKVTRLGSIIFDLRQRGWEIETEMVYSKDSNYGIYHLKGVPNEN